MGLSLFHLGSGLSITSWPCFLNLGAWRLPWNSSDFAPVSSPSKPIQIETKTMFLSHNQSKSQLWKLLNVTAWTGCDIIDYIFYICSVFILLPSCLCIKRNKRARQKNGAKNENEHARHRLSPCLYLRLTLKPDTRNQKQIPFKPHFESNQSENKLQRFFFRLLFPNTCRVWKT